MASWRSSSPHRGGGAAGTEAQKLVVVVYPSEYDGSPGIILVNRALRSTFASQRTGHVEILNEYVNTARLHDAEFIQAQVSLFRHKYAARKVDLVIAGLSAGLDFAVKFRQELFPGVPIVFVAVDEREVKARWLPPDVIGVPIRMDLGKSLDLALRLHPDTRRVFVVAGNSPFDSEWEAEARRTFRVHEGRVEFVYLIGLPMEELLDRVADLPSQSIVYFLHLHQDVTRKPFISADVLENLAAKANAPIYGHVDTYVGRGVVGGYVFRFEEAGVDAASLGLRILAGEKPESIPLAEASENTAMFDWRQLKRWGINEQNLPPGSVVLFEEPTFWELYRWHIVGVLTLCVIQALLISGLIVQRVKRQRADKQFRQVVETAPTGMLMIGEDGTIAMVNAQVEKYFGYSRNELLGQTVELLVPELVHDPLDCVNFFTGPMACPTAVERDYMGSRKDGSEFPVEIGLSSLRTARGHLVLVSVVDLTARRRAEDHLRTSQKELQALTRRLLDTQEAERRRVARELHDDVNQNLALLSLEMDKLASSNGALPGETTSRLQELSFRVKELSSSVHDLSHQLHPSKLEHLGLVTAVRGLCKELAHSHGLDATFTHFGVPEAIPPRRRPVPVPDRSGGAVERHQAWRLPSRGGGAERYDGGNSAPGH